MPLDQMRLDLAHGVEHDADDDEQTGAAEKLRGDRRHMQTLTEQTRQNGDQR